jgi:hypothetical protein
MLSLLRDEDLIAEARAEATALLETERGLADHPGLAAEVAARLRPWQDFAEEAVRICVRDLPFGALAPTADLAYAVVAGVLGLELLADLSGDRTRVDNLLTWGKLAASLAGLVAPPMGGPTSRPASGRGEEAST